MFLPSKAKSQRDREAASGKAFSRGRGRRSEGHPRSDLAAYDFYLRAKEIGRRGSGASGPRNRTKRSISSTRRSHGIRLLCQPSACWPARILIPTGLTSITPKRLELANKALEAAARLQPDGGEVHLARAMFYYWGSRDYCACPGCARLERVALLPNDADVLLFMGLIERRQGRWDESTRHMEEATILDPRNANVFYHLVSGNYIPLRRYADAARAL